MGPGGRRATGLQATQMFLLVIFFFSGQHDNYVVGGILTFFELGWYSGNIYSAVASAHKYNKKRGSNTLMNWKRGAIFPWGFPSREKLLCFS
jgi:hypothetical protein